MLKAHVFSGTKQNEGVHYAESQSQPKKLLPLVFERVPSYRLRVEHLIQFLSGLFPEVSPEDFSVQNLGESYLVALPRHLSNVSVIRFSSWCKGLSARPEGN